MNDELRPRGQEVNQPELEDDPLAELARIVAGEPEPEPTSLPEPVDELAPSVDPLESIDKQLEEIEHNLEAALAEELLPEEEVVVPEPEEELLVAAGEPAEVEAVDVPVEQPVAEVESIDFLEGLNNAIDVEIHGEPEVSEVVEQPASEQAEPEPVQIENDFEDDLIHALSQEVEAANQSIPPAQESAVVETPELAMDEELEAALTAGLEGIEAEDAEVPEPETELVQEPPVADLEPEIPPAIQEVFSGDASQDAEPEDPSTVDAEKPSNAELMEEDLGAVFANEFEQILANDPGQAQVEEYEQPEVSVEYQSSPAEAGMDFGKAFAEELGVESLSESSGWDENETQVANAAFAEAAQPSDGYADPAYSDFDPAHNGEIPDVEYGSAIPGEQENSGGSKKYAVAALVIALFAGSIAAGYGFLGGDGSSGSGTPQLVEADDAPFKVKPDDPGGRVAANEDKASYESVEGQDVAAVEQETLVSETEEPAVIDETRLVEVEEVAEVANSQKTDERLTPSDPPSDTSTTPTDLTPRIVQTVTVKPDGTIVTGPAPSTEDVVETVTNNAAEIANTSVARLAESIGEPTPVETTTIAAPEAIDGARSTGNLAVPEASPLPKPAPAPEPEPVQVATAPEPAPAPAPEPQPVQRSEWVVQVSSQRSPEAAQASYSNLRNRFPELQGRAMSIQRANVNGSTFYRVRVQTASRNDANGLCNSLKASGGSCFVTR